MKRSKMSKSTNKKQRTTPYTRPKSEIKFENPIFGSKPAAPPRQGDEIKALVVSSVTSVAPGGVALKCDNVGSIIPLNLIAPGSGFYQRQGRRVNLKSLMLDINIEPILQNASSISDTLKIAVVWDKQPNGVIPNMSDIWNDSDAVGVTTANALSSVNLNYRDRFVIIRHWTIDLPAVTNQLVGVPTLAFPEAIQMVSSGGKKNGYGGHIREYIKLKGLQTQYKADTATPVIGDVATGALYLITLATNGPAPTAGFAIPEWNSRLRFYE